MSVMNRYSDAADQESRRVKRRHFKGLDSLRLGILSLTLIACGMLSSSMIVPSLGNLMHAPVRSLTVALVLEALSWCATPIVAWMLVAWMRPFEGSDANRGRWHGLLTIAVAAVVGEVPYDVANSGKAWDFSSQNPAFAVLITMIVLLILDALSPARRRLSDAEDCKRSTGMRMALLRGIVVIAGFAWMWLVNVGVRLGIMQGGVLFLLYGLVFRYVSRHENTMMLSATLAGLVGFMIPSFGLLAVHFRRDEQGTLSSQNRQYMALVVVYILILAICSIVRMGR
ncbi:hypothetical protein [Bifidobacterium sp.]|uniref:hypothetical protein n=1 Tax=Bifidobacterium sp. TaxID=41200 RepID=UPI0039E7D3BA